MKRKLLSIALIIVLVVCLVPIHNVNATNGPSNEFASIYFSSMTEPGIQIYENGVIDNEAMEGVTYDLESNTLTLTNVNTALELTTFNMGDDFKIKLVGENSIPMIGIYSSGYCGSLTITGDGVLNMNTSDFGITIPEGSTEEVNAIVLYAGEQNAILTVEDTATVNINAQSNAICITNTPNSDTNSVIVLKNGQNLNVTKKDYTYPEAVTVKTVTVYPYEGFTETYTLCTKDGKTYGMTNTSSQVIVTSAQITYVEQFGKYYADPTSSDEPMNQIFDSVEAVEAAGYVLTDEVVTIDGQLSTNDYGAPVSEDANGTRYVYYSYYMDGEYVNYVYDISDYDITLSNGVAYKVLSENTEVDPTSLESVVNEIKTGKYNYVVSAKTLTISPNSTGEEPSNPGEEPSNPAEEPAEETAEVKVQAADNSAASKAAAEEVAKMVNTIANGGKVEGMDEELQTKIADAIEAGESVVIEVKSPEVTAESLGEEAKKIEEKLATNEKIATFYNVEVVVKIGDEVAGNVTELGDKIKIALPIPANLPAVPAGYTRNYVVYVLHNGEIIKISNTEVSGDTVVAASDKFSTYALAYEDVKNTANPQTGDNILLVIGIFAVSVVGAFATIKSSKKRNIKK